MTTFYGCNEKSRFVPAVDAKSCETDNDCIKGFVCNALKCLKGKRTAAELEAKRTALLEAEKKAEAKRDLVKPGEGRLVIRICPFFKNTSSASAQLFAVHQKTKKKHWMALHNKTPENGLQTVFKFPSLPLGSYDVNLRMGIRVNGQHDLSDMNCDPKARPCREGTIREMDVILPKDEPPPEKKEDGSPKLPPCDFIAE